VAAVPRLGVVAAKTIFALTKTIIMRNVRNENAFFDLINDFIPFLSTNNQIDTSAVKPNVFCIK